MDERPNRFIINNEEPLDDNGFSSSSNPNRIDDFDNSINEKLNNDQSDQLNIKKGQQFNAGRVGYTEKPNSINNSKKINQNLGYHAINTASTALPPGLKHAVRFGNNVVRRKNEKKEKNEQEELERQRQQQMRQRVDQELNGNNELDENQNNESSQKKGLLSSTKNKLRPSFLGQKKEDETLSKGMKGTAKVALLPISSIRRLISLLLLPVFIIAVVLIIIVGTIIGPIQEVVDTVSSVIGDFFESAWNFITFKGFHSNETLVRNFEEKLDKVVEIYPEMDRESLKAALYYGFYSFDEYLDELENEESDDIEDFEVKHKFNFKKLKVYTFTVANQLIYSTVTFDNNLIRTKHEEEVEQKDKDGNKVKTKVTTYSYSCPPGSSMFNSSKIEDLCVNNIGTITIDSKDTSSADYCVNYVSQANIDAFKKDDPYFDSTQKCVTYTFETATENSINKFNNFLKYVMIPENYFDQSLSSSESYSWSKFISQFSDDYTGIFGDNDKDTYNIPAHAIGEGKLDLYSSLNNTDRLEVNRIITSLMALIKSTKNEKNISDRYHIPGAVSLPLDFQLKDTAEATITSRITSGYGKRVAKIEGESTNHEALDFSQLNQSGDNVYAVMDGVVVAAYKITSGCGLGVYLGHDLDGDGKYDYYTRYCHMRQRYVTEGETVFNGQVLGLTGMTGTATGPHLHFELRNSNQKKLNPTQYLIDIVNNQSELSTATVLTELTDSKINELTSEYRRLISGKSHTREGVAITAKFLVDNLGGLPNYPGGYTTSLIDSDWFKERSQSGSSSGTMAKYGLSNEGFVNWALTQAGFGTVKQYTIKELKQLGDRKNIFDSSVQEGDIAYNGNNIGIIIELNSDKVVVAYVGKNGLATKTINRNLVSSPFKYAVSLENFYNNYGG